MDDEIGELLRHAQHNAAMYRKGAVKAAKLAELFAIDGSPWQLREASYQRRNAKRATKLADKWERWANALTELVGGKTTGDRENQ